MVEHSIKSIFWVLSELDLQLSASRAAGDFERAEKIEMEIFRLTGMRPPSDAATGKKWRLVK